MMKIVEPNGGKIAELRTKAGRKQSDLASHVGVSERHLRDIERQNRPVRESTLARIAATFDIRVIDLLLKPPSRSEEAKRHGERLIMSVNPVRSGSELIQLATKAWGLTYEMRIDPTTQSAPLFESVLKTVKYQIEHPFVPEEHEMDEFDQKYEFPEIHRLAALNSKLKELEDMGIAVGFVSFPGSYYDKWGKGYKSGMLIHVVFGAANAEFEPASINIASHERRLRDHPANEEADDQIPF